MTAQALDEMPDYWRERYYLAFGAEQDANNKRVEDAEWVRASNKIGKPAW